MLFIKAFTSYFHIYRPPTPPTVPNSYWDFDLFGNLIHGQMPYMKFLFVRSDICRQLPSDSTSRRTPLPLTMQFPLLGLARDFHPLDNAHAEASKKDRWLGFQPSVSVSLRSAVRLLVDNTTLFDTSLLACKVAQIVQFCTTHFTKLVDCDAVDKR